MRDPIECLICYGFVLVLVDPSIVLLTPYLILLLTSRLFQPRMLGSGCDVGNGITSVLNKHSLTEKTNAKIMPPKTTNAKNKRLGRGPNISLWMPRLPPSLHRHCPGSKPPPPMCIARGSSNMKRASLSVALYA